MSTDLERRMRQLKEQFEKDKHELETMRRKHLEDETALKKLGEDIRRKEQELERHRKEAEDLEKDLRRLVTA